MTEINLYVDPDRLGLAAEKINARARDAEGHARSAVRAALDVGRMLTSAKYYLPHGQWDAWLTENITIKPRTAQAYMRLAKQVPTLPAAEAQRVADLPLREAIKAIATVPDAPARQARERPHLPDAADRERASSTIRKAMASLKAVDKEMSSNVIRPKTVDDVKRKLESALDLINRLSDRREGEAA